MTPDAALLDAYRAAGCTASVVGERANATLVVEDHEVVWTGPAAAFTRRFGRLCDAGLTVEAAAEHVVASRPVPASVAAREGYVLLEWAGDGRLSWGVAVIRDGRPRAWDGSGSVAHSDLAAIRRAAHRRSLGLAIDFRTAGAAAEWFVPDAPALTTAVLLDRQRLTAAAAALALRNVELVVSPPFTVVTARAEAAARFCDGFARRHVRLVPGALPRFRAATR